MMRKNFNQFLNNFRRGRMGDQESQMGKEVKGAVKTADGNHGYTIIYEAIRKWKNQATRQQPVQQTH